MSSFDPDHVYKSRKFKGFTLRERLLRSVRVSDTGCWEWQESKFDNGYGSVIYKDSKRYGAHRVAAEVLCGLDIRCKVVLHSCDNKCCINPEHLSVGTSADNSADMVEKGRQAAGAKNGGSKLTEGEVRAVRVLSEFLPNTTLGEIFGVHRKTIAAIVNRKTWRNMQ